MPLVQNEPTATERPPWRGVVVGIGAALLFIVGLAFAAYLTQDTPRGVPPRERPDAGPLPDAGPPEIPVVDAGVLEGPAREPDAGPAAILIAVGPPVDANVAANAVLPVVRACLKAALRFDPALGGPVKARIVAARGSLVTTLVGAPSPVLATCVAEKPVPFAAAPAEPATVDARFTLDGMRGEVKLVGAELAP